MKPVFDLDTLNAFLKVVQTGSFTKAADALQTHKAHLSRTITQLEHDLGARLLERTTRSLSLTEVGREFHERSLLIMAAIEDARQAVEQSQAEPRGTLRLTCGVEFGMLAVGQWINTYLHRYPKMKVDVEMTSRIVDVVHEGFDIAIRLGPLPDSTLAARTLGSLTYGLYASPAYLKRSGNPKSPEELSAHDLLAFTRGNSAGSWNLSEGHESHRVSLSAARFKASNSFAARDAAVSGLGIALLPRLIGDPQVATGHLRRVLHRWSTPHVQVSAVFASARYLAPKVRAFIDLAIERFEGERDN